MFNADNEEVAFPVPPPLSPCFWHLAADTFEASPLGFYSPGKEALLATPASYILHPRSSVILVAR